MNKEADERAESGFESFIRDTVAPRLRGRGFTRSNLDFEKLQDPFRVVINFQRREGRIKGSVTFTINLHVINTVAAAEQEAALQAGQRQWGRHIVLLPTGGEWTVRVGDVLAYPTDVWWTIKDGSPHDDVVRDVLSALFEHALPATERELENPTMVAPRYVIETRGASLTHHRDPDGRQVWLNIGGVRLDPIDDLRHFVIRDYPGIAGAYLSKASRWLQSAIENLDARRWDVAVGSAVTSGVNACDAILESVVGSHNGAYAEMVALLESVGVDGQHIAKEFSQLLRYEDMARRDPSQVLEVDARAVVVRASQLNRRAVMVTSTPPLERPINE
jgi:hypothetical protein